MNFVVVEDFKYEFELLINVCYKLDLFWYFVKVVICVLRVFNKNFCKLFFFGNFKILIIFGIVIVI